MHEAKTKHGFYFLSYLSFFWLTEEGLLFLALNERIRVRPH